MITSENLHKELTVGQVAARSGVAVTALHFYEAKGLIARDMAKAWPTERGFDFLSDLQELFLADR